MGDLVGREDGRAQKCRYVAMETGVRRQKEIARSQTGPVGTDGNHEYPGLTTPRVEYIQERFSLRAMGERHHNVCPGIARSDEFLKSNTIEIRCDLKWS